jgi:RNA polymerase sigma factor (sigma-70 family)
MQAGADAPLIEASRRGDRAAFAQIIERYQRAVYAVAFSGVRDRALADDVTQDTFVIAWRKLAELRDERRLPAWLCGIARHRARDARKQAQRESVGDVVDVVHTTTPYEVMREAEDDRLVATALGQVPDVYREPLVLYYYEERSVDDVARSLGITAATATKRLSRGRRYLADCVAAVERTLARRGPSPGLAGAVIAAIAVTAAAPHVDASPAVKGSTMHKLAIAALATAVAGGAGALVVSQTRSSHAEPAAAAPTTTAAAKPASEECGLGHLAAALAHHAPANHTAVGSAHAPSLAGIVAGAQAASASSTEPNDCKTVGRHLAELEADATYGPDKRPDEATCESCAKHYAHACESQGWSVERRNCTLAAGDLINAHLCAGGVNLTSDQKPASIPPNLACDVVGPHVASIVQAAGMHADVTDLPQQVQASCDMGNWSIELRTCFADATTVDALQTCIQPAQ